MKTIYRSKTLFLFLMAAYLLAACGGALPQPAAPASAPSLQPTMTEPSSPGDNANSSNDNSAINDNEGTAGDNANTANDNGSSAVVELLGAVEEITDDAIVIDGVEYALASFTEFKDLIAVGDQVKIHVIVNADGTLTIREIERLAGDGAADNGNTNGSDDNSNSSNSNDNGNGSNSNDDDDANHNGGNSNGDDDDDDNSNDND